MPLSQMGEGTNQNIVPALGEVKSRLGDEFPNKMIKETRTFGLIAMLVFGAFSLAMAHFGRHIAQDVFIGLASLGLLLVLFPVKLRFIHAGWKIIGRTIGKCINAIILGLFYYAIFTPFALLKRLFSGPALTMKIDRMAKTYWVARSEMIQPKERFYKRY
jgi:hypothetical protein